MGGGADFLHIKCKFFSLQLQIMHYVLTDWKILSKITLYSECYVHLKICEKTYFLEFFNSCNVCPLWIFLTRPKLTVRAA
jgi:hypothetical protein